MAHKKAAGSSKNLKDSNSKYRGVKLFWGQTAKAGNIIIRQKGDKYHLGDNVYKGRDFTIHAAVDGIVTFSKSNVTKYNGRVYLKTVVNVVPADAVAKAPKAEAPKAKTVAAKTEAPKAKVETTKAQATEKKPAAKKASASKAETTEKKTPVKKAVTPKAKTETTTKPAAKKAPAKKKAE